MRITAFWAKGYRSLEDLQIKDFGPFNVFYGPNGAGKSNILAAIQLLFDLLAWWSEPKESVADIRKPLQLDKILDPRDACNLGPRQQAILGIRLQATGEAPTTQVPRISDLTIEINIHWSWKTMAITRLQEGSVDLLPLTQLDLPSEKQRRHLAMQALGLDAFDAKASSELLQLALYRIARTTYALIDADRAPRAEALSSDQAEMPSLLAAGRLKEGLFRASNHPDPVIRKRFKQLQELLAGEPLRRKPFELTHDPRTGAVELVETVSDDADAPRDIPLDLAGLGIAQIYGILGQALLRGTQAVAIEEPEAHLHAPTTGIHLRQLLQRLVDEGYLKQLFIATHSNLFDLDPDGYFDVSLDGRGATQVTRKPLSEIDKEHLYEPGPAKHALHDLLTVLEPDAVVFRRDDGTPVSASEMLDMLQRDDPVAVAFLQDVHGAAVRAVRVASKRESAAR